MPIAPESERRWARKNFDTIDAGPIVSWLKSQGFRSDDKYGWHRAGQPPTREEQRAIDFLIMEWDYDVYFHEST